MFSRSNIAGTKTFLFSLLISYAFISAAADKIDSKSSKYLELLLKKTSQDYLFDSFYNSWMENSSSKELEDYLNAEFKKSSDNAYLLVMAALFEKENRSQDALDTYKKIIENSKSDIPAETLYRKGKLEFENADYAAAAKTLSAALDAKPARDLEIKTSQLLGLAYIKQDNADKGIEVWKKLANSTGQDNSIADELIDLELSEGLLDEALKECTALIDKSKDKSVTLKYLIKKGDIYRLQANKQEALQTYNEVLRNTASSSWLEKETLSHVEQLFSFDSDVKGLIDFYRVFSADKSRMDAARRYADLLFDNGEKEKSLDVMENLVKTYPLERKLREQYAELLERGGRSDDAVKILDELSAQNPDDLELIFKKAMTQLRAAAKDDAKQTLWAYAEKSAFSEPALSRIASVFNYSDMKDDAFKTYSMLAEKFPDTIDWTEAKAQMLYHMDKKDDALKIYADMIAKGNIDTVIRELKNLESLKEYQEAYKQAVSKQKEFSENLRFQNEFYNICLAYKKETEALAAAIKQLDLSIEINDSVQSINNILHAAKQAGKLDSLKTELQDKKAPSDKDFCLLEQLEENAGDLKAAAEAADKGIAAIPNSELLLFSKLSLSRKNGETNTSEQILKKLISLNSSRKLVYIKDIIELLTSIEKYDDALKYIADWKLIQPKAVAPVLKEASLWQAKRNNDKAVELLQKACFTFQDNKEVVEMLANAYRQQGQYQKTENLYWKLLDKENDIGEKLGIITKLTKYGANSNEEHVISELQSRAMRNPQNSFWPLAIAHAYKNYGKRAESKFFLMKAAELRSTDASILLEIASIEDAEGDSEKAAQTLKKAATLDKSSKTLRKLANYYILQGETAKASEIFSDIINYKTGDEKSALSTAESIFLTIDYKDALVMLENIIKKYPDNLKLKLFYAAALEGNENYHKAAKLFFEIMNKSNPYIEKVRNPYTADLQDFQIFPPELGRILYAKSLYQTAYTYKNFSPFNYRMSGFSNGVFQNENLIYTYALCHLAGIYKSADDNVKNKIMDMLASKAYKYPDLLLAIIPLENFEENETLPESLINKYQSDPPAAAAIIIADAQEITDINQIQDLFNTLKNTRPDLAIKVVCHLMHSPMRHIKYTQGFIDDISETVLKTEGNLSIEEINLLTLILTSQNDIKNDRLRELLIGKLFALDISSQQNAACVGLVIPLLKIEEDYKTLVSKIQTELQRVESEKNKTNSSSMSAMGTIGSPRIFMVNAGTATTGSPAVENLLNAITEFRRNALTEKNPAGIDKINKIWDACSSINVPCFKLCLAFAYDKKAELQDIVTDIYKSEKTNAPTLLTAASISMKNGKTHEAIELLAKAAERTKDQSLLKPIYINILSTAPSDHNPLVSDILKKIVPEIIKMKLSPSEKNTIAILLRKNKFQDEATEMEKEMLAANKRLTALNKNFSNIQQHNTLNNVNDLLNDGNVQKALQAGTEKFRKSMALYLSAFQNKNFNRNGQVSFEIEMMLTDFKNRKIDDLFMAQLQKSGNDFCTALAAERFGNEKLAREIYEKALENNPSNTYANFKMAILSDSGERTKYLSAIPKEKLLPIMSLTTENMNFNRNIKQLCNIADFSADLVNMLPKKDVSNIQFESILQQISSQNYDHELLSNIPALFKQDDMDDEENQNLLKNTNKDKIQKINELRKKGYIKLCNALLNLPDFAETAFQKKLSLDYSDPGFQPGNEYFQTALKLLSQTPRPKHSFVTNYSDSVSDMPVSPFEFAIIYAFQHGKSDEVRQSIEQSKNKEALKAAIDGAEALYKCPAEKFQEETKNFIKTPDLENLSVDQKLCLAIKIRNLRKLDVSMSTLIIETLAKLSQTHNIPTAGLQLFNLTFPRLWADTMLKENKKDDALAFLGLMLSLIPPDFNGQFSRQFYAMNSPFNAPLYNESINELIQTYGMVAIKIAKEKDLYFKVRNVMSSSGREKAFLNHNWYYQSINIFQRNIKNWDFICKSGFIGPFKNFNVYKNASPRFYTDSSSLMQELYNRIHSVSWKDKLAEQEQQTFGTELLTLFIDKKTSKDFLNFIAAHLDEMKSADKITQFEFCTEAAKIFQLPSAPAPDYTESQKNALAYCHTMLNAAIENALKDFNAAEYDEYYVNTAVNTMLLLASVNRMDDAIKVFETAKDSITIAKAATFQYHTYSSSTNNELFDRLSWTGLQNNNNTIFLVAKIALKLRNSEPRLYQQISQQLNNVCTPILNNVQNGLSKTERVIMLLDNLYASLENEVPASAIKPLRDFIQRLNENELNDLLTALSGPRLTKTPFVIGITAYTQAVIAEKQKKKQEASDIMNDAVSGILSNETIKDSEKLAYYSALSTGYTIKQPVIEKAAQLVLSAQSVNKQNVLSILTQLSTCDKTPSWSKLANTYASKFMKKEIPEPLEEQNSNIRIYRMDMPQKKTVPGVPELFDIYFKLGDSAALEAFLNFEEFELKSDPVTYIKLLNYGMADKAKTLFEANWQNIRTAKGTPIKLSSSSENTVKKFVDSIQDPQLKILAAAFTGNMQRESDSPKKRQEELKHILQNFISSDFSNKELANKILLCLLTNDAITSELIKVNDKINSKIDINSFQKNDELYWQYTASIICEAVSQNNPEKYRMLVKDFQENKNSNLRQLYNKLGQKLNSFKNSTEVSIDPGFLLDVAEDTFKNKAASGVVENASAFSGMVLACISGQNSRMASFPINGRISDGAALAESAKLFLCKFPSKSADGKTIMLNHPELFVDFINSKEIKDNFSNNEDFIKVRNFAIQKFIAANPGIKTIAGLLKNFPELAADKLISASLRDMLKAELDNKAVSKVSACEAIESLISELDKIIPVESAMPLLNQNSFKNMKPEELNNLINWLASQKTSKNKILLDEADFYCRLSRQDNAQSIGSAAEKLFSDLKNQKSVSDANKYTYYDNILLLPLPETALPDTAKSDAAKLFVKVYAKKKPDDANIFNRVFCCASSISDGQMRDDALKTLSAYWKNKYPGNMPVGGNQQINLAILESFFRFRDTDAIKKFMSISPNVSNDIKYCILCAFYEDYTTGAELFNKNWQNMIGSKSSGAKLNFTPAFREKLETMSEKMSSPALKNLFLLKMASMRVSESKINSDGLQNKNLPQKTAAADNTPETTQFRTQTKLQPYGTPPNMMLISPGLFIAADYSFDESYRKDASRAFRKAVKNFLKEAPEDNRMLLEIIQLTTKAEMTDVAADFILNKLSDPLFTDKIINKPSSLEFFALLARYYLDDGNIEAMQDMLKKLTALLKSCKKDPLRDSFLHIAKAILAETGNYLIRKNAVLKNSPDEYLLLIQDMRNFRRMTSDFLSLPPFFQTDAGKDFTYGLTISAVCGEATEWLSKNQPEAKESFKTKDAILLCAALMNNSGSERRQAKIFSSFIRLLFMPEFAKNIKWDTPDNNAFDAFCDTALFKDNPGRLIDKFNDFAIEKGWTDLPEKGSSSEQEYFSKILKYIKAKLQDHKKENI